MTEKDPSASVRIGGLQKTSLIDFPGKVSCVLFLKGCNFSCPYCHNPDLVRKNGKAFISYTDEAVFNFLEQRKGFLDGVVISGGEPTLQEGLPLLCERIQTMGYSVKLDTNGSRPEMIAQLLGAGLVDYIAMDVKTDPEHYAPLVNERFEPTGILSSLRLIMASAPAYEFRTTCVKSFINDEIMQNIARIIEGAGLYVLQAFHPAEILDPEFFHHADAVIDEKGLMHLKIIMEPWVQNCIIR